MLELQAITFPVYGQDLASGKHRGTGNRAACSSAGIADAADERLGSAGLVGDVSVASDCAWLSLGVSGTEPAWGSR